MKRTKILGTGSFVPEKILTNADLEKMVDTDNQWILERTGIRERHICSDEKGESTSEMAYRSALNALEMAGEDRMSIDYILFATSTGDYRLPSAATVLQKKLSPDLRCPALDVQAACSGYGYAFNLANAMIKSEMATKILLVGAERLSPFVDWEDRSTCILFSDGCGVALLGASEDGEGSEVLATVEAADPRGSDFITLYAGGSSVPIDEGVVEKRLQYLKMNGRETFKLAVKTLAENAHSVLDRAGLTIDDVDWFVPHQANLRIIEACAKRLKFPLEKAIVTVDRYGNNSAATVPLAFDEAVRDGRIKRGDIVLFDVFGAGITSAASLFRY
jgi:3-oxoacyl-[acyl-carrier-protein] synthase-3